MQGECKVAKSMKESPLGTRVVSNEFFVEQYKNVRRFTEQLCEPLVTEDYVIQSMPDVSPTKWHLAHVTWFWETFPSRRRMLITNAFTHNMPTCSIRTI